MIFLVLTWPSLVAAQPTKCDQRPPQSKSLEPSENKGIYRFTIETKDRDTQNLYLPDQTYVLNLYTTNNTRPFRWFMITAEDPEVDNDAYDLATPRPDVGSLKTLDIDSKSRYSERCYSSVENADNSDKSSVEVHWVSPKQSDRKQKVRLRAMVAENEEVWYVGDNLTIVLEKNDHRPIDSPPYLPSPTCNLCSEARYEVLFKGRWSRLSHPRYYPSKPDDNGYSHMVGASHSYDYILWQQGFRASEGLRLLAEEANSTIIEREIIESISPDGGTRTLIRGKRRHHPHMSEPSHSLFRADRIHHLFSLVVGMRPSPDWFLGTTRFELCTEFGWLNQSEIPLYPWDAGTMDGVSYESPKTMTQPVDNIERVAVGSFDRESPFYQMNLNDLKPFALLQVRLLDVYPLEGVDCTTDEVVGAQEDDVDAIARDTLEEPNIARSRQKLDEEACEIAEWGPWSDCGGPEHKCGLHIQYRTRYERNKNTVGGLNINESNVEKTCKLQPEDMTQQKQCFNPC